MAIQSSHDPENGLFSSSTTEIKVGEKLDSGTFSWVIRNANFRGVIMFCESIHSNDRVSRSGLSCPPFQTVHGLMTNALFRSSLRFTACNVKLKARVT